MFVKGFISRIYTRNGWGAFFFCLCHLVTVHLTYITVNQKQCGEVLPYFMVWWYCRKKIPPLAWMLNVQFMCYLSDNVQRRRTAVTKCKATQAITALTKICCTIIDHEPVHTCAGGR